MDFTRFYQSSNQCRTVSSNEAVRLKLLLLYTLIFFAFTLTASLKQVGCANTTKEWTPSTTLRVSRTKIASDCTLRDSVVINGTSPGPELRFQAGQKLWIRVHNDLEKENTTIHWHGISQFGSPFADGTEVSQYPIPPGSFFDYEFDLPEDTAGTYMYHGHVDLDIITAYGALIIEDTKPPPYKYDAEITLLFADYFHTGDLDISSKLISRPFKALTKPNSLLLNGNALGECTPNGTVTQCRPGCHHHVIDVEPSKTYRIRTIGITTLSFLSIAIQGHSNLSFIEVDGYYVKKLDSDHLEIHSGQRYSFLLKTKSLSELQTVPNQANQFWGRMETRWRPERDKGAFLLRYQTDPSRKIPPPSNSSPLITKVSESPRLKGTESETKSNAKSDKTSDSDLCLVPPPDDLSLQAPLPDEKVAWILDDFSPLSKDDVAPSASEVTRRIVVGSQQMKTSGGGIEWLVNGMAYSGSHQLIPYLVAAYLKKSPLHPDYETAKRNHGFDSKSSTFPIKLNEVIELVVLNSASFAGQTESHPWHFHGQSPYYIASGTGKFTDSSLKHALKERRGKPYRRDTQVLFSGKGSTWIKPASFIPSGTVSGWFLLRMKAQTVGAFLIHCHIALHMTMGMMATLLIGIENLPRLPHEIVEEYMTFNSKRKGPPISFFDTISRTGDKPSRFSHAKI